MRPLGTKLVLNIQFWDGDKSQAMALARLIADLEDKPRDDVIVMFTARFDCKHDEETISHVGRKFQVIRYTTIRKATGWPVGPNQMMADSYEHLVEMWRRGKLDIFATHLIEADCVPLHKDWVNMLLSEYISGGKKVLGALLTKDDGRCPTHVNGNMIVSIDFWRKCSGIFHPPCRGGWDATLAHAIIPNATPSRLIWSDYQLGMANNPWKGDSYLWEAKRYNGSENPLRGIDLYPCYFHGIKTLDGIKAVRKRLLNE